MKCVIKAFIIYNKLEKTFWNESEEECVHSLEEATRYNSKMTAEDEIKRFDFPDEFEVLPVEITLQTL